MNNDTRTISINSAEPWNLEINSPLTVLKINVQGFELNTQEDMRFLAGNGKKRIWLNTTPEQEAAWLENEKDLDKYEDKIKAEFMSKLKIPVGDNCARRS